MKVVIVVLALTAVLKFGDADITSWTTPTITGADGTGTLTVSESQATSTTIRTYVAVTNATSITSYSITPAEAPFAISNTGALSINESLDADTTPSHTLNIIAVDDTTGTPASGTATITVTVTDVDVAPAFSQSAQAVCIATGSTAGAALVTVLATDTDPGDTITHAIVAAGNTNTDFKIDASTGAITVNTGKTLDLSTTLSYTLVVTATDDETTPQTGTTTVIVAVSTIGTCSGAMAVAVSIMTILMALVVTM